MKKILLFAALVLVSLGGAKAQMPTKISVKAGVGLSNYMGKDVSGTNAKFAYKVGVGVEKPFSQVWSLQTGLNFASKGCKDEDDGMEGTINALYLELPVMAAARVPVSESANLVFSAGPYIAIGVGGKTTIETNESGYNVSVKTDTFGDDSAFNRFDCGMGLGVHAEFGRVIAGVEGQFGFTKVIEDCKVRNLSALFTVGYRF